MKQLKFLLSIFILIFISYSINAQSDMPNVAKPTSADTTIKPAKTAREREAEERLAKAAESMERSAEKLKVVIEDKAHKIARKSQPYIENFLVAASELIEKMADELTKAVEEKPVKKQ